MDHTAGFALAGRPVVVTGAGNGIGAALAREAAARGASRVALVDIDEAAAAAVAAELRRQGTEASVHVCDVSDADAVEAMAEAVVAAHGLPGMALANAGVMVATAPLLEMAAADIEWLVGVNVRGVIHTLQSFGRRMVASEAGGWLVATGSEHSLGVPHVAAAPYTASKHAVLGVCDVLRGELPPHVGVSVICPGLTGSELWNSTAKRPERFGGAAGGDPQAGAFMESAGMSAATVASRAFDGVEAGNFVIPTHYNARVYAQRRAEELGHAFDRLADVDTTDYDIANLIAGLTAAPGDAAPGMDDGA